MRSAQSERATRRISLATKRWSRFRPVTSRSIPASTSFFTLDEDRGCELARPKRSGRCLVKDSGFGSVLLLLGALPSGRHAEGATRNSSGTASVAVPRRHSSKRSTFSGGSGPTYTVRAPARRAVAAKPAAG